MSSLGFGGPSRKAVPAVDSGLLLVLLTRLVPLLSAPVTLWLIATRRSLAEQGLYFVFWNAQALTQLMEWGIGGLIVQFASHESRSLSWNRRGELVGDPAAKARLLAVIRVGREWYFLVAAAVLIIGVGGTRLIQSRGEAGALEPMVPWLLTVFFTAAYLPLAPSLCAIEGCHGLIRVQRMRLAQVVLSIGVLWLLLPSLGALWAVAAYSIAWFGVAGMWLARTHSFLLSAAPQEIEERQAVDPMGMTQWRTGATWLAWWAAPQAVTPIVLATQGTAAAGRVGMTLAIATAPLTLAGAWLSARYPKYAALLAGGARHELRELARSATRQAACVVVGGAIGVASVLWALKFVAPSVAARAMSPIDVLILGVGNLAWILIQSLGGYLRAWREEPLMEPAILGTVLVSLGTLLASQHLGARGTVAVYSSLVALLALPFALFAFWRHDQTSNSPMRANSPVDVD